MKSTGGGRKQAFTCKTPQTLVLHHIQEKTGGSILYDAKPIRYSDIEGTTLGIV